MNDDGIHELDAFLLDALEEEIPGFKIPDLSTSKDEWLIDKLGVLKDRRKRLEKYEKIIVALLKTRAVPSGTKGNRFEMTLTPTVSTRLNQEKAKELIEATVAEELKADYFNVTETSTLRTKAL